VQEAGIRRHLLENRQHTGLLEQLYEVKKSISSSMAAAAIDQAGKYSILLLGYHVSIAAKQAGTQSQLQLS
jgi:hypothetical protein